MEKSNGKFEFINSQIRRIEEIVNDESKVKLNSSFRAGVDLGTSDVVVVVLDDKDNVAAAFLEWADVVKDGIVLDYWKAINIVSGLIKKAESKLGIEIKSVNTSYPPGTDPYISVNVIKGAGLEVSEIVDEPSSFAKLINLESGAVIDIGGGTTGISIVKDKEIIYSGDEPTGGVHLTLTIAGNQKISFDDAEIMKRKILTENLNQ
ncbi:MAG: ethanolamine utilization protein EutJ [Ignavibacterium sp.]|nr:ethanolamine utilization protein EutJ [Ignavibacterium sp.]